MPAIERFLLHCSDPADWRLRNLDHPFDPGWEVGTYSICHSQIRARTSPGTGILDIVVKDSKPIVRSAFTVNKVRGNGTKRVLYFDKYYFADTDPIELPDPFIQYRCMLMERFASKYSLKTLWHDITKKYACYRKGQRPKSVSPRSWRSMVDKTKKIRKSKICKSNVCSRSTKGKRK